MKVVHACSHVARPEELAAVWCEQQPGSFGDGEGRSEVRGVATPLVVAQPETDDATTGVLRRQARKAAGVQRMASSICRDHDADADADRL